MNDVPGKPYWVEAKVSAPCHPGHNWMSCRCVADPAVRCAPAQVFKTRADGSFDVFVDGDEAGEHGQAASAVQTYKPEDEGGEWRWPPAHVTHRVQRLLNKASSPPPSNLA